MSNLGFLFIHIPIVCLTLNGVNLRFLRIYVFFPYYTIDYLFPLLRFVHTIQFFKIIRSCFEFIVR